jgi:hypothetical protein
MLGMRRGMMIAPLLLACTDPRGSNDEVGSTEACLTDAELGPLALRLDGDRAWLIDGLDEIDLGLIGTGTTSLLRGAGHADVIGIAQNTDVATTLHAFDRAGTLSWSAGFDGVVSTDFWAGPEGLAASTSELLGTGPVGLVATQAGGLSLANHVPLGAPAQGVVPVVELIGDSVFGQPGWFDVADESFTPVALAPIDPYAVRVGEDFITFEYATAEGPGLAFVAASPSEAIVIELPAAFPIGGVAEFAATAGDHRLLRAGTDPEVFARIDLDLAEATLLEPTPPNGWDWFECSGRRAGLDPDGRALFELRSADAARVWAYDVDADAWSELGLPMSGVEDIEFAGGVGEVHVVRGIASGTCPDVEWMQAAPAEALIGDSLHVARREPALAIEVPAANVEVPVDAGRRCVAFEDAQAWQVRALDGEDVATFAGGGRWIWIE